MNSVARGVFCPACGSDSFRVFMTVRKDDGVIERRRGCKECECRWTTVETMKIEQVVKTTRTVVNVTPWRCPGCGAKVTTSKCISCEAVSK